MKSVQAQDIRTIYEEAVSSGQALAFFRLPHTDQVSHISGSLSHTLAPGKTAFAIASFDTAQKPWYIIPDKLATSSPTHSLSLPKGKKKSSTERSYINLVKGMIDAIREEGFKKIVAARILAIDKPEAFDPLTFFQKLCSRYPTAFVSLSYLPGMGLWLGASPEVLVSEGPRKLIVYSLAGTRRADEGDQWSDKEIKEQSIVTNFIRKKLQKISTDKLDEKGPMTHRAGSLKHLLTVFTIARTGQSHWPRVAKMLHPTPAVGGLPQKRSLAYIKEHESFDREFYAGYLGPVNWKKQTNLFVNLRCMQVTDQQLIFYAGCGITDGSDPKKEWLESERKIDVLKGLL